MTAAGLTPIKKGTSGIYLIEVVLECAIGRWLRGISTSYKKRGIESVSRKGVM